MSSSSENDWSSHNSWHGRCWESLLNGPNDSTTKNICQVQHKVGDAVWYLIKGTEMVKNKVRKFLPSYEGHYFVVGLLDDLVYRIKKSPRAKTKVVHHDRLKSYHSRAPPDTSWIQTSTAVTWSTLHQTPRMQPWRPFRVSTPHLQTSLTAASFLAGWGWDPVSCRGTGSSSSVELHASSETPEGSPTTRHVW